MSLMMKRAMKIRGRGGARYDAPTDSWTIKSQSRPGTVYRVTLDPHTCECAYWRDQKTEDTLACAHILAAVLQKGVITKVPQEVPKHRKSYPNAPWYEAVAKVEYRAVREMLRCLGAMLPYERGPGRGRPPACYGDLFVIGCLARYHDESSRYAIPDPAMLVRGGFLQSPRPPQASTLRDHMRTPEMRAILRMAIDRTADVVRPIETEFVMDSTSIRTPNNDLVYESHGKDGRFRFKAKNAKLNIAAGLKTHVMVGLQIMGEYENDSTAFIPTMEQFWDRFRIDTVFADAGYCDGEHYEAIAARGGVAMIDFVDPAKRRPQGLPHHDAQLARYQADPSGFLAEYHRRNLAESVNSVLIRTVTDGLRNRISECLVSEAMMFCVVYNLIRLLHARYEFHVDIPWVDERAMRIIDGLDEEPQLLV